VDQGGFQGFHGTPFKDKLVLKNYIRESVDPNVWTAWTRNI